MVRMQWWMRPGPEPSLGDLEAAALAQQQVGCRHAHVLERDLGMSVRRIVVAEHRQVAQHRHARRIARNEDHRLPLVPVGIAGVGLAHEDEQLAARVDAPPKTTTCGR